MSEFSTGDPKIASVPAGSGKAPVPADKEAIDQCAAGLTDAEGSKRQLSREEQMALYEEALKEDDWGHQPC